MKPDIFELDPFSTCEHCGGSVHKTQRKRHLNSSFCTFHQAVNKLYDDLLISVSVGRSVYDYLVHNGFAFREKLGPQSCYKRGWYKRRNNVPWVDAGLGFLFIHYDATEVASIVSKGSDAVYYNVFELYVSGSNSFVDMDDNTYSEELKRRNRKRNDTVTKWLTANRA